jgi:hypothetical protein
MGPKKALLARADRCALDLICRLPRGLSRHGLHRLLDFPRLASKPPLHVTGRADKVVLQFHLGQAAILGLAQTEFSRIEGQTIDALSTPFSLGILGKNTLERGGGSGKFPK